MFVGGWRNFRYWREFYKELFAQNCTVNKLTVINKYRKITRGFKKTKLIENTPNETNRTNIN